MPTFNLSFAAGTTVQQMLGFEIAARVWSSYLTDNTTINLHVGVSSSLPSNVIGGALPGIRASQSYSTVRSLLATEASRNTAWTDDDVAVNNLIQSSSLSVQMFAATSSEIYDISSQTSTLNLTRANAKALGMSLTDGATALDGYILFGSLAGTSVQWNYDYTRSAVAPSNSLDFLSTAIHEIGHILGFVSGVDKPGWLAQNYGDYATAQSVVNQRATQTTILDLFRYSGYSTGLRPDISYGYLDSGDTKYFSLDKGVTRLAQFSTGADTTLLGDGQQASHWKSGTNAIMAPTLTTGQRLSVQSLDLRALDVIGWDLASTAGNTIINFSTLETAAKQSLATRAGQTVTWLNNSLNTSPTQLVRDRTLDIASMILNSQIYNLGDETGDEFWQRVNNLFWEQGLFSTLDELTVLGADDIAGFENSGFALPGSISVDLTGVISLTSGETTNPQFQFQANLQFKFDLSNLLNSENTQAPQTFSKSTIQTLLNLGDGPIQSGFSPLSGEFSFQSNHHWSHTSWASFTTSRSEVQELEGEGWGQTDNQGKKVSPH
jgi:hypothetical protein